MKAVAPEILPPRSGPPIELRTVEVRWIRQGPVPRELLRWFAGFAHIQEEKRKDDYLRTPDLAGLSIKIRGGESLDVKQHRAVVGDVQLDEVASGQIDEWVKFSFALSEAPSEPAGWLRVGKHRRISAFPAGDTRDSAQQPSVCFVELTGIDVEGEEWWTLGFESTGPGALAGLERTAALIFSEPPPIPHLLSSEATSYVEWLRRFASDEGVSDQPAT